MVSRPHRAAMLFGAGGELQWVPEPLRIPAPPPPGFYDKPAEPDVTRAGKGAHSFDPRADAFGRDEEDDER